MRKIIVFVFIVLVICLTTISVYAMEPLDEIKDYHVTVNMRPDGTMDIRYRIEWKVLDDTSEGPLTWVKIGCPNKHVDEITAYSDNIKEISYYIDGGSYIRIDLDREYFKGEVITFDYSIHQSYMYVIEEEEHICRYSFTPGWFDEMEVKKITILWNDDNVIESSATSTNDGYLVWEDSLSMGERLNASVKYNLDVFTVDEAEQYTEDSGSSKKVFIIFFIILLVILVIFVIVLVVSDDYDSGSGFGGGSGYRTTYISRGGYSSSCVSSCACACACAGGGRAGCSKKDFYNTKLKSKDIKKALE